MEFAPRSFLYVPGNRPNMLARAPSAGADALILDLEDSVPPAEKETARGMVAEAIAQLSGQRVYVRVNGLSSGLTPADLEGVVGPGLEGIVLPKAESAAQIAQVEGWLAALEAARGLPPGLVKIRPLLETALGVLRAYEIASASPRVTGLSLGAEDFALDLGVSRSREGIELFCARSSIVVAARAAGVDAIDIVFTDVTDEEGLIKEAEAGRQLGYKGKSAIHPRQVGPINRVFSPTDAEVAWAQRVVAAFDEAAARGVASLVVDGRMVDIPIAEKARRILALAQAMAAREGK